MRLKFWIKPIEQETEEDELYKAKERQAGETTLRLNQTMADLERVTKQVLELVDRKASGHG